MYSFDVICYDRQLNHCYRPVMLENNLKLYYLQQLGIDCWVRRTADNTKTLQALSLEVAACQRCDLHQTRTHTVFARGNPHARLMIIGEAPGNYEDKQGIPFVGKVGQLLNRMLASIGLSEQEVYFANVLKCIPPNHRDPEPHEIAACRLFISQQIQLVSPRLIVAVGQFVGQFLLGAELGLGQLRSVLHHYEKRPFIVTYDPAFLLRNPREKKQAYLDWLFVKENLGDDVHLNASVLPQVGLVME